MKYIFHSYSNIHKWVISVVHPETKAVLHTNQYPSFTEMAATGLLIADETLVDIGVMASTKDVRGYEAYLKEMKIIGNDDSLISEQDYNKELADQAMQQAVQQLKQMKDSHTLPDIYLIGVDENPYAIIQMICDQANQGALQNLPGTPRDVLEKRFGKGFVDLCVAACAEGITYAAGGTIDTDTPIIPELIADQVAAEVVQKAPPVKTFNVNQQGSIAVRLVDYLTDKANTLYKNNVAFRKQINARGNKGRDVLYAFMQHWSEAWIKKGQWKFEEGGQVNRELTLWEAIRLFELIPTDTKKALEEATWYFDNYTEEKNKGITQKFKKPIDEIIDEYKYVMDKAQEKIGVMYAEGGMTLDEIRAKRQNRYFAGDYDAVLELDKQWSEQKIKELAADPDNFKHLYKNFDITKLVVSSENPLSKLLQGITGDGYNSIDYDGSAGLGHVLTHGKTGLQFTVVNEYENKLINNILFSKENFETGGTTDKTPQQIFDEITQLKKKYDNSNRLSFGRGYGHGDAVRSKLSTKIDNLKFKLGRMGYVYRERAFGRPTELITNEQYEQELASYSKTKNFEKGGTVKPEKSVSEKFKEEYGVSARELYEKAASYENNYYDLNSSISQVLRDMGKHDSVNYEQFMMALMEGDIADIKIKEKDKIYSGSGQDIISVKAIEKLLPKPTDALHAMKSIVSKDELRSAMTGVYYDAEKQVMVATNAHCLAVLPQKITGKSRIISIDTGKPLIAKEYESTLKFPSYEQVLPSGCIMQYKNVSVAALYYQLCGIKKANSFIRFTDIEKGGIVLLLKTPFGNYFFSPVLLLNVIEFFARCDVRNVDFYFNPIMGSSGHGEKGFFIKNSAYPDMFALQMPLMGNDDYPLVQIDLGEPSLGELTKKELIDQSWAIRYHQEEMEKDRKEEYAWGVKYHQDKLEEEKTLIDKTWNIFEQMKGEMQSASKPGKPDAEKPSRLSSLTSKIKKQSKKGIAQDKSTKAIHPGKRVSAGGNEYTETRPNRSDEDRRKKL